MPSKLFMSVDEVANTLDISRSTAYKVMRTLNKQLKDKGYLTISGKINRAYFMQSVYKEQ